MSKFMGKMTLTYQYLLRAYQEFHDNVQELKNSEKSDSKINQAVQASALKLIEAIKTYESPDVVVEGDERDLQAVRRLYMVDVEKAKKVHKSGGFSQGRISASETESSVFDALSKTSAFVAKHLKRS